MLFLWPWGGDDKRVAIKGLSEFDVGAKLFLSREVLPDKKESSYRLPFMDEFNLHFLVLEHGVPFF